jgi:hypothetical protein
MDDRKPLGGGAGATLLVPQHIACEPPAAYEDEMRAQGVGLHRVEVDEGEVLPDWRAFDGIVAMGGPMGAYDDATHAWLAAEKQLIAGAVRAGLPYWGVCLGAQVAEHADEMTGRARRLFAAWLERVVGLPRREASHVERPIAR